MVKLTLTDSEAEALAAVLYRVGGDPAVSSRGKTQAISAKLRSAGVKIGSHKFEVVGRALWFKPDDGSEIDPTVKLYAELLSGLVGR